MLKQRTFWDTTSVTSSQESADGPLHFVLPESAPIVAASQDPVRVNLSLMQGKDSGPPTLAIYGPTFADSSHSVSLQSSLENKLRARMDVTGSLEYVLTWKHWDMQSGSSICALRASARKNGSNLSMRMGMSSGPDGSQRARRTSDSDCGGEPSGYPTPAVQNSQGGVNPHGNTGNHFTLQTAAGLVTGYPTPQAHDTQEQGKGRLIVNGRIQTHAGDSVSLNLPGLVVTGYPTPQCADTGTPRAPRLKSENCIGNYRMPGNNRYMNTIVGYGTPSTRDYKDTPGMATTGTNPDGSERTRNDQIHGLITPSDTTETASPGVLAQEFSLWLMGYPARKTTDEWASFAPGYSEWESVQRTLRGISIEPDSTEQDV